MRDDQVVQNSPIVFSHMILRYLDLFWKMSNKNFISFMKVVSIKFGKWEILY